MVLPGTTAYPGPLPRQTVVPRAGERGLPPGEAAGPPYRGGVARVAVVGAGLGALAAAARLAALGHAVTVLEQAPQVGGKLGWYARDGHGFDTGPSLVTLPQLYRDLFAATGGPLEDAVDLVRLDPAVAYRFTDGTRLSVPEIGRAHV